MAKIGFIFPGQGSQSVGMLADLAATHAVVRDTFTEASDVLGYDLFDLVMNGPAEELGKTFKTQPALLTASVALYRLWCQETAARPVVMAGHSLGEYSALTCAGAIEFKDAVNLVRLRGEFMQNAVPAGTGAMAAVIGLADDVIVSACAEAAGSEAAGSEVCSAVNFNSPGQVVIAGSAQAVERASEILKAKGAKRVLPLAVSVPSHCALMKPAALALKEELAKISVKTPAIPVINNVDVVAATDAASICDALVRQLYSPVRWVETVQKMAADGVDTMIEMGPNKVLTGLVKRIEKSVSVQPCNDVASLAASIEACA